MRYTTSRTQEDTDKKHTFCFFCFNTTYTQECILSYHTTHLGHRKTLTRTHILI